MILFKSATRRRAEDKRVKLVNELLKIEDEKSKIKQALQPEQYFKLLLRAGNISHDIKLINEILNHE